MKKLKTVVVLPAYNASKTLEKTLRDIPHEYVDEIILVDDASKDKTEEIAEEIIKSSKLFTKSKEEYEQNPDKILFSILVHKKNRGYGGNQKNCYKIALAHGADIIIMLHPDYQYDPKIIKHFVLFMQDNYFDVMLGSRIRSRKEALAGGMPPYKYYANRMLSFIENVATGRVITDWHTGMRAYTKEVLLSVPFESFSDDFVFDSQMLFGIIEKNYTIGDIPVPVRYFEEASSINFKRSMTYGLLTLREVIKFLIRKIYK